MRHRDHAIEQRAERAHWEPVRGLASAQASLENVENAAVWPAIR